MSRVKHSSLEKLTIFEEVTRGQIGFMVAAKTIL